MSRQSPNLKRALCVGIITALTAVSVGASVGAQPGDGPPQVPATSWVSTWTTAAKTPTPVFDAPPPTISDTTLRQVVRVSTGGWAVRVWFTNEYGTEPLAIGEARVALRRNGNKTVPGSDSALTFAGESSVDIPAGERLASDPVRMQVGTLSELAISLYFPDDVTAGGSPVSFHPRALQTNYVVDGNQTAKRFLSGATTVPSWFFLSGVDVAKNTAMPVIAAIGDSIIDGDQVASAEPIDVNDRFTDFLAERILWGKGAGQANGPMPGAVLNLGISGNQITDGPIGPPLEQRLAGDVLTRSRVTHVIVQGGINDVGLTGLLNTFGLAGFFGPVPRPEVSADDIIAGLERVAAQAKASGLTVIGSTLSPSGTSGLPGYVGPDADAKRQVVNEWIRSTDSFDMIIDVDAVLRDPANPSVLAAKYSADGLHPNAMGYAAMADAAYTVIFS